MTLSIIMTLFDREPEVILSTLRSLRRCALEDAEVVVVDDLSRVPTHFLEPILGTMGGRLVKMPAYDPPHTIDGFKNPAKAFNLALAEARGERLIVMSSDVLVPPRVIRKALSFEQDETIFCPMVIDLDTGHEYCGPNRIFPMPWFLATSTAKARECGGWDENYMLGQCFEDNDFVGRLALTVGSVTYDWNCIVWHQSHFQPAYSPEPWIQVANQRNRIYTVDKWGGGIPFDEAMGQVWEIARGRHVNGDPQQRFLDTKGRMERFRTNPSAVGQ